jgi:hypothetical protein
MEIVDKILSDNVVSKKTIIGSAETQHMILERIKNDYVEDTLRIWKEIVDIDEIIDLCIDWKSRIVAIIETEITTENYFYKDYFCYFLDNSVSICFRFIMYKGQLINISTNDKWSM